MSLEALDRSSAWMQKVKASRPYVPWVLVIAGAVALFLAWFGVSGTAVTAKQLPYVVSGGLTGVALFVVAAAFFATDDIRRQLRKVSELEDKVERLYTLLVEEVSTTTGTSTDSADRIALPGGRTYHRPTCSLVVGKDAAAVVSAAEITGRSLTPCRICDPA